MTDISAVVVALVLITLFFGAVLWLELHSRRTASNQPGPNAKRPETHNTEPKPHLRSQQGR